MTEILTFPPTKKPDDADAPKRKNAIEALEYILDAMKRGDTDAEGIVIVWNSTQGEGAFHLRYMLGGNASVATIIGMMEMAKIDLLE